jgi:hypothetical protein
VLPNRSSRVDVAAPVPDAAVHLEEITEVAVRRGGGGDYWGTWLRRLLDEPGDEGPPGGHPGVDARGF